MGDMNRRRSLSLLAATGVPSLLGSGCQRREVESVTRWRGVLFNSDVDMALHDLPASAAEALIRDCELEMQRLEKLFSLYLPDSPLSRLNRTGRLDNPPPELVDLVRKALLVAERSGGAFDPTIQPYWTWLRETVETTGAIDPEAQAQFLEKVDFRQVRCGEEELSFGREGMALTLNGLSQGWITDRATKILRDGGAQHCLVNLGEFYGLGTQPSGRDWIVVSGAWRERRSPCGIARSRSPRGPGFTLEQEIAGITLLIHALGIVWRLGRSWQ